MLNGMSWACPACGHLNGDVPLCDACGVARHWHEDPPLDLPAPPAWHEVGASYLTIMWSLLALGGLLLLALPSLREWVGIHPRLLLLEVSLAGAAAWSAMQETFFQLRFNSMGLEAPRQARTGQPVEIALTLVPYRRVRNVDISFQLLDRFYQEFQNSRGGKHLETREQLLAEWVAMPDQSLPGRRSHRWHTAFPAPFPGTVHEHLGAKIMASLLEPLGFLVPGLRHTARNLREHGGFYIRATVRIGLMRRRFEQRVVSVYMGERGIVAG